MTAHSFDHQRLDVYRLSIEYVAASFDSSESLTGRHRHARDQWLRAAESIPLNIAEGNGKRSRKDRARFLDIARGLRTRMCRDSGRADCHQGHQSSRRCRDEGNPASDRRHADPNGDEVRWCRGVQCGVPY